MTRSATTSSIATSAPPQPARIGSANRRRSRSSPRSNSRPASSPTTKKKNVIRPLFTLSPRASATPEPPTSIESRVDPQPASHLPAAHLHEAGLRARDELVRLLRVGPDQHPALAARGDRHVAADEEREAAEHLLLGQTGLAGDLCADALGKLLVVGHGGI